jgi:hypothetical protein
MGDFVSNIEKYAKMATEKPQDFGYWGSSDMFDTWGFTNVDQNRDSDALEKANFKYITEDLMGSFPEDFRIETYNHWAVGSVDRLVCRIYEEDRKTIALPFLLAMEWLDKLDDYPVADEDTYQDMVDSDNVDSLDFWNYLNPGFIDTNKSEHWASDILYELEVNMDTFVSFENGHPKDDDIIRAIYNLQYWNPEKFMEWYRFCDDNGLERPPFTANEISKYDETQLVLEIE